MRWMDFDDEESAGELRARLGEIATRLLLEWLPKIPTTEPVPQSGSPTYAEKLTVDEFAQTRKIREADGMVDGILGSGAAAAETDDGKADGPRVDGADAAAGVRRNRPDDCRCRR